MSAANPRSMTGPVPAPLFSRGFVAVFLLGFSFLLAIYYQPRMSAWGATARWGAAIGWLIVVAGLLAYAYPVIFGRKKA